MPHTTSAKKALRQTEKRNLHNKAVKKAIRLQIRKFLVSLKDGTPESKKAELAACAKKIDKAAANNVIHRNAASRRKSQLAKRFNAPPVVVAHKK